MNLHIDGQKSSAARTNRNKHSLIIMSHSHSSCAVLVPRFPLKLNTYVNSRPIVPEHLTLTKSLVINVQLSEIS